MPFTFSHPAIILSLTNKKFKLSSTGLIIGSLIPDFEYFIRMKVESIYSHTPFGLFWFDLPLGIIVCLVYHNIVRTPFINNAPAFIQKRMVAFESFNWTNYFLHHWFIVSISILLGASSHLLWDSCTHATGYFVERNSALQEAILINGVKLPAYKIIQHVSSLLGGLIVLIIFIQLEKKTVVNTHGVSIFWLVVALLTLIIVFTRFISGLQVKQYGNFIVTTISAALITLTLTSIILKKKISNQSSL